MARRGAWMCGNALCVKFPTSRFRRLFIPKPHTSVHTASASLLVGAGGCQVQPAQPALAHTAPHVLQRVHPS